MSHSQYEQLTTYFREAKWRRNSIIADFVNASRKAKSAIVKVGDTFEERQFSILGSQVVQDIYDSVKTELKILHIKKEKGDKVGKLKFKSVCNCIPLRQYNSYPKYPQKFQSARARTNPARSRNNQCKITQESEWLLSPCNMFYP